MSGKKIMIVEDESVQLTTLARRLKSAGFEVTAARDGMTAISTARKEQPDLIPSTSAFLLVTVSSSSNAFKFLSPRLALPLSSSVRARRPAIVTPPSKPAPSPIFRSPSTSTSCSLPSMTPSVSLHQQPHQLPAPTQQCRGGLQTVPSVRPRSPRAFCTKQNEPDNPHKNKAPRQSRSARYTPLQDSLVVVIAIMVVVMIVPVVLRMPPVAIFVPPFVKSVPAFLAGLMQIVPRVVRLPAVPAMMLHCFVKPVIRLGNAMLAIVIVSNSPRRPCKQQESSECRCGHHGHPYQLAISPHIIPHQGIPPVSAQVWELSEFVY
jgi:hypothetical protein